jgi:signal transduction histidine kinase
MRSRNSLRIKVARAFGILVAAISLAWATVVISGVRLTEDRVLLRQLRLVAEDYALRFSTEGGELAPETSYFQSYDQVEKLPPELADWANETPNAGYYELQEQELHVAVLSAGEPPRRLYVVFDVAGIEAASYEDFWWFAGLTGVVILLTFVAIGLGTALSRRVVEPVTRLADVVGAMNPEQLTDDDWRRIQAADFPDDEVGLLAGTIEKTLQRICAFVEREKYFTSAASHELRTPVTVMSGALELLENSSLSNGDARAVARIKRATNDMRTTIEMFLCLSRESNLYGEHFLVAPVVEQAIDQHRHLLENKNIKVELELSTSPEVFGHPQAFAIAVNNLVRNAFEHSPRDQGPITVTVDQLKVSVRNRTGSGSVDCDQFGTGRASQSETSSFGLGLDIVRRLCEHNGWTFDLRASADLVDASLSWSPQRLQPAN